jgi:hypothetical protein
MLSIILLADRNERRMVATLASLVTGAAAGLVREVLMVEPRAAGSAPDEAVARVADVAGCRVIGIEGGPAEARDAGGAAARSSWLMMIRSGAVPEAGWTDEVAHFLERDFGDRPRAATFKHARSPYNRATVADGAKAIARYAFGPFANQGLLVDTKRYRQIVSDAGTPLTDSRLLSKIGRRNIVTLRTRLFAP